MNVERWKPEVLRALSLEKDDLSTEDIFPAGELTDLKIKEKAMPAVILVEGPIDPSKIVLEPSLIGIKHNQELDSRINTVWNESEKKFKEKFPDLEFTNGLKVLAREILVSPDKVTIKTGVTDYKERIATIKPEFQIAQKFGPESVAIQLATSSIILTEDGKICLAQLGTKTDEKNRIGGIHTIAGLLDMQEDKTPAPPLKNILSEISEELGFTPEETKNLFVPDSVLGIIQDPKIYATDIIYLIKAEISEKEIRFRRETSDKEIGLVFIDNTAEAIKNTLLTFAKTATATALSGLYLYGKNEFGNGWAHSIRERLMRRFTVWSRLDLTCREFPEEIRGKTANRLTRLYNTDN